MSKDALNLGYDTPVDRIAARLLWKDPNFRALPERTRNDLVIEPPRIKPEDVTFVFDKPPRAKRGCQQPVDHRGKMAGVYLVLGYAGAKDTSETRRLVHGGRPIRSGHHKGIVGGYGMRRTLSIRTDRMHFWWIREPDGTVSAVKWDILRRLRDGETFEMAVRRRHAAKHASDHSV